MSSASLACAVTLAVARLTLEIKNGKGKLLDLELLIQMLIRKDLQQHHHLLVQITI